MSKGHEAHKSDRKKAKLSLKEKRQRKREKKHHQAESVPDTDMNVPPQY
jgi:hypothetical protein